MVCPLQEILLDDQILKLGVNIGGDVLKLAADYGVQVRPVVPFSCSFTMLYMIAAH